MTIIEQDIEFFKEAKRIQELWEPKIGDWVSKESSGVSVVSWTKGKHYDAIVADDEFEGLTLHCHQRHEGIWLPRQGQLQEMLAERGYGWSVDALRNDYQASIFEVGLLVTSDIGPTPSIALGKCLLEVLGKEGDMPKELKNEITKGQRP